jgi:hypothetical protein
VLAGTIRILGAQLSPAFIPGWRDILNTREGEKSHALILEESRLLSPSRGVKFEPQLRYDIDSK